MKALLIAAVLALAPVAAQAQVAAASVPNTFDRPASAAPTAAAPAAPAAPALSQTPADERSEATLRGLIASGQSGEWDYSVMSDDLAAQYRQQAPTLIPVVQGFGPVQAVDFIGSHNDIDIYAVVFSTAATEWRVGMDESGKVAALLFRPAQ